MAIDGFIRRWPYGTFSTPYVATQAVPKVPPAIAVPPMRRRFATIYQFEQWRDDQTETLFVEPEWQLPRRPPWVWSEFEQAREPIPKVEVPFVHVTWEFPHGRYLLQRKDHIVRRERFGFRPPPRPPFPPPPKVYVQWHVPWALPVRRMPWQPLVPQPEPPPPQQDVLPPYVQWHLVRRVPRPTPDPWQAWVPTGGGYALFEPVRWEKPVLRTRISEPFGQIDFTARDFEHGVNNWAPVDFALPPPRQFSPVPYIPLVVPEDVFVERADQCPRPMRRPDTKC